MKNTKRTLRASEAERIRSLLEDIYIDISIKRAITVSERWDDPGDYERDTEIIEDCDKQLCDIEKAIEPLGGLDKLRVDSKVYEYL